jgi:hypothetical protein
MLADCGVVSQILADRKLAPVHSLTNFNSSILERRERDERWEGFHGRRGGTYNAPMQGAATIATVLFAFEIVTRHLRQKQRHLLVCLIQSDSFKSSAFRRITS